jgi:cytochrome c-type biogenesis protein CcmH
MNRFFAPLTRGLSTQSTGGFNKIAVCKKPPHRLRRFPPLLRGLTLLLLLLNFPAFANSSYLYPFSEPQKAASFQTLTNNLRCLVCQNEPISQSNAPLAADLRQQIYEQLLAGKSETEIRDYVVSRYGDYVLYSPPFNDTTLILWLSPFALLLVIFVALFWRRKKS